MPDTERAHLNLVPPLEGEKPAEQSAAPQPEAPAAPRRGPGRPAGSKDSKPRKKAKAAKVAKKAAKKTRAAAAPPAAPKTQERKQRLVNVRSKELQARAEKGDVDAVKLIKVIQGKHSRWQQALAKKAEVSQECGQRLKSAEAAFQNAIEAPLEVGRVELAAVRGKLETVEGRWQDLSEAKAQNIEERKEAREAVKAALEALNEAIEDSRQQRLAGIS